MKAIDIVNYLIDHDLTNDELVNLGKKLLAHSRDEDLLNELNGRDICITINKK